MTTTSLFDRWIAVDWSASAVPKSGPDSIWIADCDGDRTSTDNPRTRLEAMDLLLERIDEAATKQQRLLIGFDFPFGYPAGSTWLFDGGNNQDWRGVWDHLGRAIEDGPKNRNNRFDVAKALNARQGPDAGPFWGCPANRVSEHLAMTRPKGYGASLPNERRLVESRVRRAQPTWKLFTTGSVGSQALMGIAALERLRRARPGRVSVWPFETGLGPPQAHAGTTVLVEIYPSLIDRAVAARGDDIKDRAQVSLLAEAFARLDREGALDALFRGPPDGLNAADTRAVVDEEGWILGIGHETTLEAAAFAALNGQANR
ncbi:MAG: cobalamin biosynthesis protein CbiG [Pseudomonadota bacterium]